MSHNMTVLNLSDKEPSAIGIISTDQYRKWFTTGNLFNAADADVNEPGLHYITLDLDACSDVEQALVFMAGRLAKAFSATVQPFDIIDAVASLTGSADASKLLSKTTEMMFKLARRTVVHLINDPAGYQFELSMSGMTKPKKVFTLWRLFEIVSGFDLASFGDSIQVMHRSTLGLTPEQIAASMGEDVRNTPHVDQTTEAPMDKYLVDFAIQRTCPKVDLEHGGQFGETGADTKHTSPELRTPGYHTHVEVAPITTGLMLDMVNNLIEDRRESIPDTWGADLVDKIAKAIVSAGVAYAGEILDTLLQIHEESGDGGATVELVVDAFHLLGCDVVDGRAFYTVGVSAVKYPFMHQALRGLLHIVSNGTLQRKVVVELDPNETESKGEVEQLMGSHAAASLVGADAIEIPAGDPATYFKGQDALDRIKAFSIESINLKDFQRTTRIVLDGLREVIIQRCGKRYDELAFRSIALTIVINGLPVEEFLNAIENVCVDSLHVQRLCSEIDCLGLESDKTNMWRIMDAKHRSKPLIELLADISKANPHLKEPDASAEKLIDLMAVNPCEGVDIDYFNPPSDQLSRTRLIDECDEEVKKMATLIAQIYGGQLPECWTDETVRRIARMCVLNDVKTSELVCAFLHIHDDCGNGLDVVEAILDVARPFEIVVITSGGYVGCYYWDGCEKPYMDLKDALLSTLSRTSVKPT